MRLNSCTFVGYAGRNPDVRTTTDGLKITNFSLPISTWNREEQVKGEPIWLRIVAFGKLAETVEKSVKKGSQVVVAGRFSGSSYTNKEGVEKTAIEIIANDIEVQHSQKPQESQVNIDEIDREITEQNGIAQPDMAQQAA